MKHNFPSIMDEVFRHEGGYVNHRNDPGGETNYGISKRAHPSVDIRSLTKAQAREIYRKSYWAQVRGDDLPDGLDLVAMDAGVNSGVSRGSKWLQKAIGTPADGKIGPNTLAAARAADPLEAIEAACAARMGFLRGLRTWSSFGKGWTRRVASVEAVATRLALEAQSDDANAVVQGLQIKGKAAAIAARSKQKVTAGASAVAAVGMASPELSSIPAEAGILGGIFAAIAAAVSHVKRQQQLARATAMRDEINDVVMKKVMV